MSKVTTSRCDWCGKCYDKYMTVQWINNDDKDFCCTEHYNNYKKQNKSNRECIHNVYTCSCCNKTLDQIEIGTSGQRPIIKAFCNEQCIREFCSNQKTSLLKDIVDLFRAIRFNADGISSIAEGTWQELKDFVEDGCSADAINSCSSKLLIEAAKEKTYDWLLEQIKILENNHKILKGEDQ